MTASVTYWRLPDEESDFVDYLESSAEPVLVLPVRTYSKVEDVRWMPPREAFGSNDSSFLITPAKFAPAARVVRVDRPDGQGFKVHPGKSPVVFYTRGNLAAPNRLYTSAISADWTYLADDDRTFLDHPAEFVRWGKRVMQWVRKAAPGWYRFRRNHITAKAEAARQAGLELVL